MLCWLVLAALDDKVVVDWHASWRIAMFSSPLADRRFMIWLMIPLCCYSCFLDPYELPLFLLFSLFHDSACGCWPGMLWLRWLLWILNTKRGWFSVITSKRRWFFVWTWKIAHLQRHRKRPLSNTWGLRSPVATTNWPSVKIWRSSWLVQAAENTSTFWD